MPLMCLVLYFLTNKSIPIFHSFHHVQTKRLFVKVCIVTRKSLATFLRQKPLSSRSVILPKNWIFLANAVWSIEEIALQLRRFFLRESTIFYNSWLLKREYFFILCNTSLKKYISFCSPNKFDFLIYFTIK